MCIYKHTHTWVGPEREITFEEVWMMWIDCGHYFNFFPHLASILLALLGRCSEMVPVILSSWNILGPGAFWWCSVIHLGCPLHTHPCTVSSMLELTSFVYLWAKVFHSLSHVQATLRCACHKAPKKVQQRPFFTCLGCQFLLKLACLLSLIPHFLYSCYQ